MEQNIELNKVFYFSNPEHNALLTESLSTEFFCDKYLDVVFILKDNKIVKAHKLIFTTLSQFLTDIICKSNEKITFINLPDVDYNIMTILLDILYDGVTKVNDFQLTKLHEVIQFLGIELSNFEAKSLDPGLDTGISYDRINRRRCKQMKSKLNSRTFSLSAESPLTSPDRSTKKEEVFIKQELTETDVECDPCYDPLDDCEDSCIIEESQTGLDPFDMPLEVLLNTADRETHGNVPTVTNNGVFPSLLETDIPAASTSYDSQENAVCLRPQLSSLRNRSFVGREVRHALLASFKENKFLTPEKKAKLAEELNISEQTVSNWFNNRRALEKRSGKVKKVVVTEPARGKQVFTEKQRLLLENEFQENKFLDTKKMENLAKNLGVSLKSIRNWFTHRRVKDRTERILETGPQHSTGSQRGRQVFSKERRQTLEAMFKECRFPSTETKRKIAKDFGVSEKTINNWFVFRRQKEKDRTGGPSTKRKITTSENTQETKDSSVKGDSTDDDTCTRSENEADSDDEEQYELEM